MKYRMTAALLAGALGCVFVTEAHAACGNGTIPQNKVELVTATKEQFVQRVQKAADKAARRGWTLVSVQKFEGADNQHLLIYNKCVTAGGRTKASTEQIVKKMNESGELERLAADFEESAAVRNRLAVPRTLDRKR